MEEPAPTALDGSGPERCLPETVQALLQQTMALWWASDGDPFPPLPTYTSHDQARREPLLDRFLEAITSELSRPPRDARDRPDAGRRRRDTPRRGRRCPAFCVVRRTCLSLLYTPNDLTPTAIVVS